MAASVQPRRRLLALLSVKYEAIVIFCTYDMRYKKIILCVITGKSSGCNSSNICICLSHCPLCPNYDILPWDGVVIMSISGIWPGQKMLDSTHHTVGQGLLISPMEICSQALDPMHCYHNILITYKQHYRWRLFSHRGFTACTVLAFSNTNMPFAREHFMERLS